MHIMGVMMMRYFSAFRHFGEIRNINPMYVSCVETTGHCKKASK